MEIILLPQADEDLAYWKRIGNKRIMNRISALLADILEHPFSGIGKPEPLKGTNGKWSRRINDEHRMIYSVSSGFVYVYVFSLRYHYSKYARIKRISQGTDSTEEDFHDIYEEASAIATGVLGSMQTLARTANCKGVQIHNIVEIQKL